MTENEAGTAAAGEPFNEATRQMEAHSRALAGFTDKLATELGVPTSALPLPQQRSRLTAADGTLAPEATQNALLVYLDMKDWVALSRGRLGRPEGPHETAAYKALQSAVDAGDVIVPLTATTYMELDRVASVRRRTALADVMAEVSGFVTITNRSTAVAHQLQCALAKRFGGEMPTPIRPLGFGISFATGSYRRLALRDGSGNAPHLPHGQLREVEIGAQIISEYFMARGPDPEDLPALRAYGYRPEAVIQVENERLRREQELAQMLKDDASVGDRLGDIVHARYIWWELREHLAVGLQRYGIDLDAFFDQGKEWITEFLHDIPSAAVSVTLSDKGFRNSYKAWTGNDLRDGDAVSAAVPYCDVVMTDKYVAAQLARDPAVGQTVVLSRLRDLVERLPDLIVAKHGG